MTSRVVLPWIGGPSSISWPGRTRNSRTEYSTTIATSTNTGIETPSSTYHRVSSGPAWVAAEVGNQSMTSERPISAAEATTPTTTISTTVRFPGLTARDPNGLSASSPGRVRQRTGGGRLAGPQEAPLGGAVVRRRNPVVAPEGLG